MIKHAVYRILQGAKSIDVWDDYVATLKRMGVDEITEITQNAYESICEALAEAGTRLDREHPFLQRYFIKGVMIGASKG